MNYSMEEIIRRPIPEDRKTKMWVYRIVAEAPKEFLNSYPCEKCHRSVPLSPKVQIGEGGYVVCSYCIMGLAAGLPEPKKPTRKGYFRVPKHLREEREG